MVVEVLAATFVGGFVAGMVEEGGDVATEGVTGGAVGEDGVGKGGLGGDEGFGFWGVGVFEPAVGVRDGDAMVGV